MSAKIVFLLTVAFIINEVNCKCEKGQNETMCWTVRCGYVKSCSDGQVLVEADPKNCICCRYCEKFHISDTGCSDFNESSGCCGKQTPESCHAVDCREVHEDDCEKGQHFVKADYSKCICCDRCENDCSS